MIGSNLAHTGLVAAGEVLGFKGIPQESEIPDLRLVENLSERGIDLMIQGLGETACDRKTLFGEDPYPNRTRLTGFIPVNGYHFLVRASEPHPDAIENPKQVPHIVHFLGMTEMPDAGTGKFLHDALALANPGCRTLTAETLGVSKHGRSLPVWEALIDKSLDEMAAAHLNIAARIAGKNPITLVGESLGAGQAFRVAHQNQATNPEGRLNIQEIKVASPCIIASKVDASDRFRTSSDWVYRLRTTPEFFGHMAIDLPRTSARKPLKALRCAISLGAAVVQHPNHMARAVPAVIGNFINILPGIDWETITDVVSQHQILVLVGSRDTLREEKMYRKLQELYPDNIRVKVVPGEGHSMAIDAREIAEDLTIATVAA